MKTAEETLNKFGYVIYVITFLVSTITNVYGFVLKPTTLFAVWVVVWTVCMAIMGLTIEEMEEEKAGL